MLEVRHPVGQRQQLVDLFFVLGEYQSGFAVAQEIGGFLIQHVAIQPERHRADGMGGDLGRHPVRPVVADDADDVAATEAEFDHAEGEVVHPRLIVVPGEQLPEPKILFAQRDLAAMLMSVEAQQLRIGVGLFDAFGEAVIGDTGLVLQRHCSDMGHQIFEVVRRVRRSPSCRALRRRRGIVGIDQHFVFLAEIGALDMGIGQN